MKPQLANRLGLPHIRHVLELFCSGAVGRDWACESLGISQTNLYKLHTSFLHAKAAGSVETWSPGLSGGNQAPAWPAETEDFIRRALAAGYSHAFAASEVERLFGQRLARSQVRHWAIRHGCVPPPKPPRLPAHLRRWQRGAVGELWQLDATPYRWFGPDGPSMPLLDMIDDCSRLQVGCAIYREETVSSYLSFLRQAFERHGLPLEIYVDHARAFESNAENSVTRLGQRLKFYDVSLVFANSPEAKGKVERIHQVWQDRLPAYFRLNTLTADTPEDQINQHLAWLQNQRNNHEMHRELKMTPRRPGRPPSTKDGASCARFRKSHGGTMSGPTATVSRSHLTDASASGMNASRHECPPAPRPYSASTMTAPSPSSKTNPGSTNCRSSSSRTVQVDSRFSFHFCSLQLFHF